MSNFFNDSIFPTTFDIFDSSRVVVDFAFANSSSHIDSIAFSFDSRLGSLV